MTGALPHASLQSDSFAACAVQMLTSPLLGRPRSLAQALLVPLFCHGARAAMCAEFTSGEGQQPFPRCSRDELTRIPQTPMSYCMDCHRITFKAVTGVTASSLKPISFC